MDGFPEDTDVHTVSYIDCRSDLEQTDGISLRQVAFARDSYSSINSYGYSPLPLKSYLAFIRVILLPNPQSTKPFIISITSNDPTELRRMLEDILKLRQSIDDTGTAGSKLLGVELNTSCPNIPGKPPPSYNIPTLIPLLHEIGSFQAQLEAQNKPSLTIGLKLPPYVYTNQFVEVVAALKGMARPISFLTCTNTLGSSVLFADQSDKMSNESGQFALPTAFGGMAGEAIHSLSLG